MVEAKYDKNGISIHTPTQGVTLSGMAQSHCGEISIHTPTQGVTRTLPPSKSSFYVYFNPHSHAGSDREYQ